MKKSDLNLSPEKFEENVKIIEEKIKTFDFDNSIVIFHTNEKKKEPFIIYEKLFFESDENEFIRFDELFNYIKKNNREQYKFKEEKLYLLFQFLEFLNKILNKIKNSFIGFYNVRIELTFKENKKFSNFSCHYKLYNPEKLDEKWKEYKDLKIINLHKYEINNGKLTGLSDMINEINNEQYKNIAYMKYFRESPNNIVIKSNNGSKVLLLKYLKKIDNQDYKIKKKQFYSIKTIKIDDNNKQLIINDAEIKEKKVKIIFHHNNNENKNKYFVTYDSNIHIINFNNNNDFDINEIPIKDNNTCNFILNYNNQYIFGGNKGVYMINNIENVNELKLKEKDRIISKEFKGGIRFIENLFAFISNENKIHFLI